MTVHLITDQKSRSHLIFAKNIATLHRPANYRWSSYRANGLGQPDPLLTPNAVYSGLGLNDLDRQDAYRTLFRPELDAAAISDIRLALDQGQPVGDSRFIDHIERVTGQRRQSRPRGRPRKVADDAGASKNQVLLKILAGSLYPLVPLLPGQRAARVM